MTKKEAIDKIKKCLALSASSNEHEAELALRQAKAHEVGDFLKGKRQGANAELNHGVNQGAASPALKGN